MADEAPFAERAALGAARGALELPRRQHHTARAHVPRRARRRSRLGLALGPSRAVRQLGMEHVTLEFDGAGTPVRSSHMSGSARDWARFGQLYLYSGRAASAYCPSAGWSIQRGSPTAAKPMATTPASGRVAARPAGLPSASGSACLLRGGSARFEDCTLHRDFRPSAGETGRDLGEVGGEASGVGPQPQCKPIGKAERSRYMQPIVTHQPYANREHRRHEAFQCFACVR